MNPLDLTAPEGGLWKEGQYMDTHTGSVPEKSWKEGCLRVAS